MSETRQPAAPNPVPAEAKPEKIDIAVSVARVPTGEWRVVILMGAVSIALTVEDTLAMAKLMLDGAQCVKDATAPKVEPEPTVQ